MKTRPVTVAVQVPNKPGVRPPQRRVVDEDEDDED
jgi:hypothetical protein